MMRFKGFVVSLLMVLFTISIVQLADLYANKTTKLRGEVAGAQATLLLGYVNDDVAVDLSRILGANLTGSRNSSNWTLTVRDALVGNYNRTTTLNSYATFLQGVHTNRTGVNSSINVSALNDSVAEITFSNGLRYDYNYGNPTSWEARFYNSSGATGATEYQIDIQTTTARQSLTQFTDTGGSLHVLINYTDGSGRATQDVHLSPTAANTFTATLSGDPAPVITITVGAWNGNNGALVFNITNSAVANFNYTAVFPKPNSTGISWSYDAPLNTTVLNSSRINKPEGQRV